VRIGDSVTVTAGEGSKRAVLEWASGSSNDLIADAVIALMLLENELALGEEVEKGEEMEEETVRIAARVLDSQFGEARVDEKTGRIFVDVDGKHVIVDIVEVESSAASVTCADAGLKLRVEKALARLLRCIRKC